MSAVTADGAAGVQIPGWAWAVLRWVAALLAALVGFGVLLLTQGADPLQAYVDMARLTAQSASIQQIIVDMTPLVLGALAVAVPARAGLTNVGGEGQIVIGGVAACGSARFLDDYLPAAGVIVAMVLCSMVAGALWAGIAALMRLFVGVNEAITTLLLNFVAIDVLLFLIYDPWREDPAGQPTTEELVSSAQLPVLTGTKVHIGIFFALVAAAAVWFLLSKTRWGFMVSVAGGNAEAARRAGMRVPMLLLTALLVGGALAGLAGMLHFSGVEYKLRTGFADQLGYVSFLACWLARHKPFPILLAAGVFAGLSVGSNSLQFNTGLPAASINILTALILIVVIGFTGSRKKARP